MQRWTKLIDVGVDWLTLTTKESSRGVDWHECFAACAAQEQAKGHKWQNARRMMYGGESCGGLFWGKSDQGWMTVLSSEAAQTYGALFEPDAVHCTRIDIQVTVDLTAPEPNLLETFYNNVVLHKTANGRPVKYTLIKDTEAGRCLYVGARSSMLYGRVYDKGVEEKSAPPGQRVRYELEVKGDFADQAVAMIWGSAQDTGTMLYLVRDFFEKRRIPALFQSPSLNEKFVSAPRSQDDIQSMKWLSGPVASVVARLTHTCGIAPVFSALFAKAQGMVLAEELQGVLSLLCADYASPDA